jgi:RNA polymerase sigma factor (sigma-70 family)
MNAIAEPNAAPDLAGDAVYRDYYPFLMVLARDRLDRAAPGDAAFGIEDLVQEIAAAVYRGRKYFDPERGRLTNWLARMASRTAIAIGRSRAAKRVRSVRATVPEDETVLAERPDPRAGEPDYAGDFWQLLAGMLTTTEVRALVLRFVEGLDLNGVGARLGFQAACASAVCDNALKKLHRRRFDLLRALGL